MQSNVSVHVDMTAHFSTSSVFLSSGNKCSQNVHLPGVGLHVDTTTQFSSIAIALHVLSSPLQHFCHCFFVRINLKKILTIFYIVFLVVKCIVQHVCDFVAKDEHVC